MLVDQVELVVEGGAGGNGCIAFRRERYVPRGGPDGGDGGNGGDCILQVDLHARTLLDVRHLSHVKAERGSHGRGKSMTGRRGADRVLSVPAGTQVYDLDANRLVGDLTTVAETLVVARGGRGGRGNGRMATPTRRTPRIAEDGKPGEKRRLRLELKLLADVGLVGLPNAGKSTLISRLSDARPRTGSYPFTTLAPNLGLVRAGEYRSYVMADLPGLVEGAHQGKGLGLRFLKHIERTRVLLFLVDSMADDPRRDYEVLVDELGRHDAELLVRPRLVVLNKVDVSGEDGLPAEAAALASEVGALTVSAVTGAGLPELRRALERVVFAEEEPRQRWAP